jgi:hypothetical protein
MRDHTIITEEQAERVAEALRTRLNLNAQVVNWESRRALTEPKYRLACDPIEGFGVEWGFPMATFLAKAQRDTPDADDPEKVMAAFRERRDRLKGAVQDIFQEIMGREALAGELRAVGRATRKSDLPGDGFQGIG